MKSIIIVLDTETCNIVKTDIVKPHNNLTYNIGWRAMYPSDGTILTERSYVVDEIFFGERARMDSCYYASKLPKYYEGIKTGEYMVASFFEIMNELSAYCKSHNVVAIVAHNARFDVDALNTTARYLTGLYAVRALPAGIEIWDSMKMANSIYGKRPTYRKFCEENGYMTNHKTPRCRLTAEVLYRFIADEPDFEEEHTALADVAIESLIVLACYKAHKKMDRVLYHA